MARSNREAELLPHHRVTLVADQDAGWVFVTEPDEPLAPWLKVGAERDWGDARTLGRAPGQPVLFLRAGGSGAWWVGSGRVVDVSERWRAFGVRTRCVHRSSPPIPAVPPRTVSAPGPVAWENRALAARLGLDRFRSRTPYLDASRAMRLTSLDLDRLEEVQPRLATLWPE